MAALPPASAASIVRTTDADSAPSAQLHALTAVLARTVRSATIQTSDPCCLDIAHGHPDVPRSTSATRLATDEADTERGHHGLLERCLLPSSDGDVMSSVLSVADVIASSDLKADDLVSSGVIGAIIDLLDGVMALVDDSDATELTRLEDTSVGEPRATALVEIVRGILIVAQVSNFTTSKPAIHVLIELAAWSRPHGVVVRAGVVEACVALFKSGQEDPIAFGALAILSSIASSPASEDLLEAGAVEMLVRLHGKASKYPSSIDPHMTLTCLAMHHRAALAFVLVSPACVDIQVTLLLDGLRPSQDRCVRSVRSLTPSGSHHESEPTAVILETLLQHLNDGSHRSLIRGLQKVISALEDPTQRTQLVAAGLEATLQYALASEYNGVRVWAEATRFWVCATIVDDSLEAAVVACVDGDEIATARGLEGLLHSETLPNDTLTLVVVGVAALQSPNDELKQLAIELLLKIGRREPATAYFSAMTPTNRARLMKAVLDQLETMARGRRIGLMQLLEHLATTDAFAKRAISDHVVALLDVVRSGTLDEQTTAAFAVVAVLDGHMRRAPHGEHRTLVVAIHAGLVHAFIGAFNAASSNEVAASYMTRLAGKLLTMTMAAGSGSATAIRVVKPASASLVVLLRALLSLAKTGTGNRATLAVELAIQWTTASPGFVGPLVDAGAITVVERLLVSRQRSDDETFALGAVRLDHTLALVRAIADVNVHRPKLTAVVCSLTELTDTKLADDFRAAIKSVLDAMASAAVS